MAAITSIADLRKIDIANALLNRGWEPPPPPDPGDGSPATPVAVPTAQELRDQFTKRELLRMLLPFIGDDELSKIQEVVSNRLVRPHRGDYESVILDEPVEVEREAAAKKRARDENNDAPSEEDTAKLYTPPVIEPTMSSDGSFVESITVRKWEMDPSSNTPVMVEVVTPSSGDVKT